MGAGRHERSSERLNWRNGYHDRALDTRFGALQLRVPKLRQGSLDPLRGSSPAFPRVQEGQRESASGGDSRGLERWGVDPPGGRAGPQDTTTFAGKPRLRSG